MDLDSVQKHTVREVIQVIYVLTGCDFTSFFYGLSKQSFLKSLYEYSSFITASCRRLPGSLADVNPDSDGFLAFVRLVGVTYFTANKRVFQDCSPVSYFDNYDAKHDVTKQHREWYGGIQEKIWERVCFEDLLPPSLEALKLHWLRSIWVVNYWGQACEHEIIPLPTEAFGWTIEGGKIGIEWDSQENLEMIRNSVSFLLKGCGCKTGCTTARCKCIKSRKPCGPGCSCGTKCINQGMQHF